MLPAKEEAAHRRNNASRSVAETIHVCDESFFPHGKSEASLNYLNCSMACPVILVPHSLHQALLHFCFLHSSLHFLHNQTELQGRARELGWGMA